MHLHIVLVATASMQQVVPPWRRPEFQWAPPPPRGTEWWPRAEEASSQIAHDSKPKQKWCTLFGILAKAVIDGDKAKAVDLAILMEIKNKPEHEMKE